MLDPAAHRSNVTRCCRVREMAPATRFAGLRPGRLDGDSGRIGFDASAGQASGAWGIPEGPESFLCSSRLRYVGLCHPNWLWFSRTRESSGPQTTHANRDNCAVGRRICEMACSPGMVDASSRAGVLLSIAPDNGMLRRVVAEESPLDDDIGQRPFGVIPANSHSHRTLEDLAELCPISAGCEPHPILTLGYSFKRMRRYSIWPRSPSRPMGPVLGNLKALSRSSPLQVQ